MDIARRHDLKVVEDAAQGVMSSYKGKALGTIGDFGCYSFHETKNYSMGEGGALVINNPAYNERAEILREKGTAKDMCANIDMYSGFVYSMMGIPEDLFTPLFACARMSGWAAHRFEEIVSGKRIIRPAYKSTRSGKRDYVAMEER